MRAHTFQDSQPSSTCSGGECSAVRKASNVTHTSLPCQLWHSDGVPCSPQSAPLHTSNGRVPHMTLPNVAAVIGMPCNLPGHSMYGRTRPAIMLSQPKGLLNRKAVLMPASESGQSFICSASICAAMAAVGDSMGVGERCGSGLSRPAALMCCENSVASVVPASAWHFLCSRQKGRGPAGQGGVCCSQSHHVVDMPASASSEVALHCCVPLLDGHLRAVLPWHLMCGGRGLIEWQ